MERVARIAVIDDCGAKEYENEPSSPTPSTSKLLPHFDRSGLPKTMEETWAKADQILQKNGITKVQAAVGMSVVISLSRPT